MRVLISGGGTGGHVYPAMAVATALGKEPRVGNGQAMVPNPRKPESVDLVSHPKAHDVVWVGSENGIEEALVQRAGLPYRRVSTGQLRGKNPLKAAQNAGKMVTGVRQSGEILSDFQADVCLVTGGYVCAPVVVACRRRRVPVLIYLPDMAPGSAVRWLSRLAQRVAVTFPDAAAYFGGTVDQGGKAVVTGYPVRPELLGAAEDRQFARRRLSEVIGRPSLAPRQEGEAGDDDALPLLLVWGGSQGSRSINQSTWHSLPHLLPHMHVVHVVGVRDWEMAQPSIDAARSAADWQPIWSSRYHPVDYLHDGMSWALAAADLTVARAGASVLGEFPIVGLPSILVPLPIAGVGQRLNARVLEEREAAIVVSDEDLADRLVPVVLSLMDDGGRLKKMQSAAKSLARPNAAQDIASELLRLASGDDGASPTEE